MTDPDTDTGFDLFAGLSLTLGQLNDTVAGLNTRIDRQRNLRRLPRQLPLIRSSVSATGSDLVQFDGPAAGRFWEVRLIGVFELLNGVYTAIPALISTFYAGQAIPGAGAFQPTGFVRWQFTGAPNFENFSGDQFRLQSGEDLMVGLAGIPVAPTNISVMAVINDIPTYDASPVVEA